MYVNVLFTFLQIDRDSLTLVRTRSSMLCKSRCFCADLEGISDNTSVASISKASRNKEIDQKKQQVDRLIAETVYIIIMEETLVAGVERVFGVSRTQYVCK